MRQRFYVFGVHLPGHRRKSGKVGKQHRHPATLFARRDRNGLGLRQSRWSSGLNQRRAALLTKPMAGKIGGATTGAGLLQFSAALTAELRLDAVVVGAVWTLHESAPGKSYWIGRFRAIKPVA